MQRGEHHTQETRARMKASWTEERKRLNAERFSERLRRLWADPEFRARQIALIAEGRGWASAGKVGAGKKEEAS
jgi:hypothetical protein